MRKRAEYAPWLKGKGEGEENAIMMDFAGQQDTATK